MRRAELSDLDSIMELETACFGEEAFTRRQYHYLLSSPHCEIFLHDEGAELAGMIAATWRSGATALRICSIAVSPAHRGRGIGSLLLRKGILMTKALKRRWLVLEVNAQNNAARRLYEKFGFTKIGDLPDYYGKGKHGERMALEVLPPTGGRDLVS